MRNLNFVIIFILFFSTSAIAQTIPVYELANAPKLDASDEDWNTIPFTVISLKKTKEDSIVETKSLSIKAGTHSNQLFVFIEWKDKTLDKVHKPWVWDKQLEKYVTGPNREDRLAIHFSHDENYTTDWMTGQEFTADTWHWKASRSNPLGLAHDKSLVISQSKLLRAYKLKVNDGKHIYISRPSDSGIKLYKTKRYRHFKEPVMPKYVLSEMPTGSIADVKAQGMWSKGKWQLELSRELVTHNDDDVIFPLKPGHVLGGIAVFNRSENNDHAISETLKFEFLYAPAKKND